MLPAWRLFNQPGSCWHFRGCWAAWACAHTHSTRRGFGKVQHPLSAHMALATFTHQGPTPAISPAHTQKMHSGIKHLMTLMAHSTVIRSRHVEIITGPEPRMTDFFPIQHMFYLDVCFFPPFLLLVSQTIIWFCGNREKHLKTEILNHTYLMLNLDINKIFY